MKLHEILNEKLGNLRQLGMNHLMGLLNQGFHGNKKYGYSHGPDQKRFQQSDIGPTSQILDGGQIKDIAGLRKAIRAVDPDGDSYGAPAVKAFALYIGGKPVAFGRFSGEDLAGSSREGGLAYDLSAFDDIIERDHQAKTAAANSWNKPTRMDTSTVRDEEKTRTDYDFETKTSTQTKYTNHYTGSLWATRDLKSFIDETLVGISKETGLPITVKLVMTDAASQKKRSARYSNADIKKGFDELNYNLKKDLQVRLQKFKNSKKPTIESIAEFVKEGIKNSGKIVQFAGRTYQLLGSSSDKIDPMTLLKGGNFRVSYSCKDPGAYDSLTVTYHFDKSTGELKPVFAQWSDKTGDRAVAQEAIIDPEGFKMWKFGTKNLTPEVILPTMLKQIKDGNTNDAETKVKLLRKLGLDWPELAIIERSIQHEKDKKANA